MIDPLFKSKPIDIGLVKELFDYKNGELFWKKRVSKSVKPGMKAGTLSREGYIYILIKRKVFPAHRIIWVLLKGYDAKCPLDHINGIKSDNRIENLRESNSRLNSLNYKSHRNGRLFGAKKLKNGKWDSVINIKGKLKYLGRFETELEAHNSYRNAAREYGVL